MEKYTFTKKLPHWVEQYSEEELITFTVDDESTLKIKEGGKGLCYIQKEVIHTSNSSNEKYNLTIWNLNNSDVLQGASVKEVQLRDDENLEIHKIAVIRNGQYVDITTEATIRVLDDEKSSHGGTIQNYKKINITISNLHISDILIFESTHKTVFGDKSHIDKKYYKSLFNLPGSYFFYKKYNFKIINDREENIKVQKRYFKTQPNDTQILKQKEAFLFEKDAFQSEQINDSLSPIIDISTESTWQEITTFIHSLYKANLQHTISDAEVCDILNIKTDLPVEQKIRSIIEYVQNNIVYIYDADIMHGHIPRDSNLTLNSKSGDCKAKSLLLINMLKAIGVDSDFVLVNYGYDYFIQESLPSPLVFNHAIVKISDSKQSYFVDATITNQFGSLEKRSQPFFKNYLEAKENTTLQTRNYFLSGDINVEEHISISLKEKNPYIKISSIFRRESADTIRANFIKYDSNTLVESENKYILGIMFGNNNSKDSLFEYSYKIISDDKDQNIIETMYEAKLRDFYTVEGKHTGFRYYLPLNIGSILSFNHKDVMCSSFVSYPIKTIIEIESDLFIRKDLFKNNLGENLEIHNSYFDFVNKKSSSFKSVKVISEYIPKTYEYIETKDLQNLKDDFHKINNSNYGIGIIFQSGFEFFITKLWILLVLYQFVRIFMSPTTSDSMIYQNSPETSEQRIERLYQ